MPAGRMRHSRLKTIVGMNAGVLVLWTTCAAASSGASAGTLSASQICEIVRENYASLSSYSDQGRNILTMDGADIDTEFTTMLARTGYYRIEWEQFKDPAGAGDNSGINGAWESGSGDYIQTERGMRRQYNRDLAFYNLASRARGLATVPRIFFGMHESAQPGALIALQRLADSKVGATDCYQITGQTRSGQTKTFWIGKQDLLIHQIRTEVSPDIVRGALEGMPAQTVEQMEFHGFYSLETYTNIVVNKKFSPSDFVPSFPLYEQ